MGNVNLTSLNFTSAEKSKLDRELVDHLFMLKEQLEYTLSNLGMSNFNQKEIKVFAESLKVTGVVTFKDLAENSETLINGAYIKSGIFEGSVFRTFTEEEKIGTTQYFERYGAVHMYYVPYNWTREEAAGWDGCLMGGLELENSRNDDTDVSTGINLRLYARNFAKAYIKDTNMPCALKLSSEHRISLEAQKQIYIRSKGSTDTNFGQIIIVSEDANGEELGAIYLKGLVRITGALYVNGKEIKE